MSEDLAICSANECFYKALSARDLPAMEDIWLAVDWAECVHPGWPVLHGWGAIRRSWQSIFAHQGRLAVTVSDVRLRVAGDVAWVACIEHISTWGEAHLDTAFAQATNIFLRRDGRWRLVVHHASPVVAETPNLWQESRSIN